MNVREEIAPEHEIDNLRKWTALKIQAKTLMKYNDILDILRRNNVHGNWTMYEIIHRPADIDELVELIEEGILK